MVIATLLVTMPIIPHHHHFSNQEICLLDDVDAISCCPEHSETGIPCNHNSCTEECITQIQSLTPDSNQAYKLIQPVFQLIYIHFNEFRTQLETPLLSIKQYSTIYIESLHGILVSGSHGLRAPPFASFC